MRSVCGTGKKAVGQNRHAQRGHLVWPGGGTPIRFQPMSALKSGNRRNLLASGRNSTFNPPSAGGGTARPRWHGGCDVVCNGVHNLRDVSF
eukprot:32432-Eustigmatos_ZCMA.PRE.1